MSLVHMYGVRGQWPLKSSPHMLVGEEAVWRAEGKGLLGAPTSLEHVCLQCVLWLGLAP